MTEKLGLAFSGGGFRASFYHIGVLAQMAEQGLLRHVEAVSTVSGGSIIGALYYLHVKKLLESKLDADITDGDYVRIVQQIEVDFLNATQRNIRMETFSSFKANFKMALAHYSRSDRLAELYNAYLYQAVLPAGSNVSHPIQMRQLKIQPFQDVTDFSPKRHNAARTAKVPVLILNATTLNTGRNWQFTAKTMGEPRERLDYSSTAPEDINDSADKKNIRLRRAKNYSDMAIVRDKSGKIVLNQQVISLGHAVAASACVPGLFYPLSITGLYKDSETHQAITPQLVDGGVYDNQAIEGLLQNHCTCFVISDAAGQMGVENDIATDAVSVLLRVSDVLQDRVRSESLKHLLTRQGESGKSNVAFVDMRQGLAIREIAWVDKDGQQQADQVMAASSQDFNVDPRVQESLSLMRTDLDAFTEVEAYSLMLDGYQMSEPELRYFKTHVKHAALNRAEPQAPATWKFAEIAPWLKNPTEDYLKQLEIAKSVPFKALQLFPVQLGLPLVALLSALIYVSWEKIAASLFQSIPVYSLLATLFVGLAALLMPKLANTFEALKWLRPINRLGKAASLVGATLFFKFYLKYINPLFLARGSLAELKKRDKLK